mmetsp:Transcript_36778/g.92132  ORF Transcript_36778/g.92132 Transcript_36778/m.92132 type:complete len:287 (-) Transcript_36778:119-979(-)
MYTNSNESKSVNIIHRTYIFLIYLGRSLSWVSVWCGWEGGGTIEARESCICMCTYIRTHGWPQCPYRTYGIDPLAVCKRLSTGACDKQRRGEIHMMMLHTQTDSQAARGSSTTPSIHRLTARQRGSSIWCKKLTVRIHCIPFHCTTPLPAHTNPSLPHRPQPAHCSYRIRLSSPIPSLPTQRNQHPASSHNTHINSPPEKCHCLPSSALFGLRGRLGFGLFGEIAGYLTVDVARPRQHVAPRAPRHHHDASNGGEECREVADEHLGPVGGRGAEQKLRHAPTFGVV